MASVTYAQAKKWDETARKYGDFRFDVQHYVLWGEKALIKQVRHEGYVMQYSIKYFTKYERFEATHTPVYIIDKLVPTSTEGVYHVIEVHREAIGEATAKKSYNTLCKLSADVKTEEVA